MACHPCCFEKGVCNLFCTPLLDPCPQQQCRGQALFNKEVQPLLEAAGIQARVVCTNSKGHATELVTGQRPDQIDAIAVVGALAGVGTRVGRWCSKPVSI